MIYFFSFLDLGQAGEANPQDSRLEMISFLLILFQTEQLLILISLATEFPDDERFKLFKVYRKHKTTSLLAEELPYNLLRTHTHTHTHTQTFIQVSSWL